MAPGVGGGGSSQPAPSPAHTSANSGHRGVQRSISATSGNKPRRGSTGPPSAAPMSANNNQTTSNFKRQNTVDSATNKAKSSSGSADSRTPTSPKARGITKSNTMSNATGRGVASVAAANRRSAIDPSLKSSSTDKTNILDGDSHNNSLTPPGATNNGTTDPEA